MNILKRVTLNMPDLPSSCCCGQVKLSTASRFFATFRLVIAGLILLFSLEEVIKSDLEEDMEFVFDEEFIAEHEEFRNITVRNEFKTRYHRSFLKTYYTMLSVTIILGVVEVILCSLQIHGVRKKVTSYILPYVIWTGILMIVFSLIFLFFFSIFVRRPIYVGFIITLSMGGFLALSISDFIYALANYKQMKVSLGDDHVRLNEI